MRIALALSALLLALPVATATAAESPDAIARRMQAAMGGNTFARARVIRFDWAVQRDGARVVEYKHAWDRWSGDYRVEGTDRESGQPWLALFNVNDRDGRVWLGQEEVTGEALAGHLERAYGRFINDSYWLLMPWKWLDPGVLLSSEGTAEVRGELCDIVGLSFGSDVGLTSNDHYRGYVSRQSGRMLRWSYVLQTEEGTPGEGEPTVWDWTDWTEVEAGAWFGVTKTRQGEGPTTQIVTPNVELVMAPTDDQLEAWFKAR